MNSIVSKLVKRANVRTSRNNYSRLDSISQRVNSMQLPTIPIIMDLFRSTPDAISLAQGVVNFSPPKAAMDMLIGFSLNQYHTYGPVSGLPMLLDEIRSKLEKKNNIQFTSKNSVCVTAGANMAFVNILYCITDPGDEIVLLSPYYFNYEMAVKMVSCVPVIVPTDSNYQPILEKIAAAISPKTKAVVTISPNNPTGAVYPESTLRSINALCKKHGIYHISDEPYENFLFEGENHFSSASIPDSDNHTISLFSFSKSYALASWRVGYMVFPANLQSAVHKVQDTLVICPPVISQYVATGALSADYDYFDPVMESLSEVRKIVYKSLAPIRDKCSIPETKGAFYIFIRLPELKSLMSSLELSKKLVTDYGVATIPGESFGMTDACYLRVSFGNLSPENAEEGISRLVKGIQAHIA